MWRAILELEFLGAMDGRVCDADSAFGELLVTKVKQNLCYLFLVVYFLCSEKTCDLFPTRLFFVTFPAFFLTPSPPLPLVLLKPPASIHVASHYPLSWIRNFNRGETTVVGVLCSFPLPPPPHTQWQATVIDVRHLLGGMATDPLSCFDLLVPPYVCFLPLGQSF